VLYPWPAPVIYSLSLHDALPISGMERIAARDSGAVVIAKRNGVVDFVDSERIIVKADHRVDGTISREVTADIYSLVKFKRSNQRSEEHTSELQSRENLVCRLLLE